MNTLAIFLFTLTIFVYNFNCVQGSSSLLSNNEANINQRPKMSAFAKKAGGKWKSEFSQKSLKDEKKEPNNFGQSEVYRKKFVEGVAAARDGPGGMNGGRPSNLGKSSKKNSGGSSSGRNGVSSGGYSNNGYGQRSSQSAGSSSFSRSSGGSRSSSRGRTGGSLGGRGGGRGGGGRGKGR